MNPAKESLTRLLEGRQKEIKALQQALDLPLDDCILARPNGEQMSLTISSYHLSQNGAPRPIVQVSIYNYRAEQGVWRETDHVREILRNLAHKLDICLRQAETNADDVVTWYGKRDMGDWDLQVSLKTGLPTTCRVERRQVTVCKEEMIIRCS